MKYNEFIQTGILVKDVHKMDNILNTLVQVIEQGAFPYFFAQSEYRQNQHYAEKHMQWLEEHLDAEAKEHLEKARDAECCVDTLEREALIRTALAVGIRLALPC